MRIGFGVLLFPFDARYFAQRAFCAAAIFAREAAVKRPLFGPMTVTLADEPLRLASTLRAWVKLAISLSISCTIVSTLIYRFSPSKVTTNKNNRMMRRDRIDELTI